MGKAIVLAFLAGCSSAAVPLEQEPEPVVARTPQCVWHFTKPSDTADSDQITNVSTCSADAFELHDGALNISVDKTGSVNADGCQFTATNLSSGSGNWFVTVDKCGLDGIVGVNY